MSKQPFLPLFFGDFLASTAEWEGEERSLYLLLLGYQWSLGSLPIEPRRICRLVGWGDELFERCWKTVSMKFVSDGGRLLNHRLEFHRAKAVELAEKNASSGRKGAQARWKNGERHTDAVANAIISNGERHKIANGEILVCGNATTEWQPSHPIPSHPNPIQTREELEVAPRKACRLPDNFDLTEDRRKVAIGERIDPDRTFAKFLDYWKAASGAKARKVDWDATWRNWCRNDSDRSQPKRDANGVQW